MLDAGAPALRELTIKSSHGIAISTAFVSLVEQNLSGLEKVALTLWGSSDAVRPAISCVLGLPRMRAVNLQWTCSEPGSQVAPFLLRSSPCLERLGLEVPCAVIIAMPALRFLELSSSCSCCTINCPTLEELVLARSTCITCDRTTAAQLRVLNLSRYSGIRLPNDGLLAFPALARIAFSGAAARWGSDSTLQGTFSFPEPLDYEDTMLYRLVSASASLRALTWRLPKD